MNFKITFTEKVKQDSKVYYRAQVQNLLTGETRIIHLKHEVISELHDKLENCNGYSQQLPSFPSKHSFRQTFGLEKKENMITRLNKYFEQLIAKPPLMNRPLQEFFLSQVDQLRKYVLRERFNLQYWDELLQKFNKLEKIKSQSNRFIKCYSVEHEQINYILKRFTLPRVEVSSQLSRNYLDLHLQIAEPQHIVKVDAIFQINKRKSNGKKNWFKAFNFQKQVQEPQQSVLQVKEKDPHPYTDLFPIEKQKQIQSQHQDESFIQYLVGLEQMQGFSIEEEFLTRRHTECPFEFDTILNIAQSMSQALQQIHKVRDFAHHRININSIIRGFDQIWRLRGAQEPIWSYLEKWEINKGSIKQLIQIPPEKRENGYKGFQEGMAQRGDIYQLGLVLLRLCTLCTTKDIIDEIDPQHSKGLLFKIIETRYGSHFSSIIRLMISYNPAERPNSSDLVNFFYQTSIVPMKLEYLSNTISVQQQKQRWRRIRLEYDPILYSQKKITQIVVNRPNNYHEFKQLLQCDFKKIEELIIDLKNTKLSNLHLIELESKVQGLQSLTIDISGQNEVTLDGLCLFLNMLREVKSLKKVKIYAFQFRETPIYLFEDEINSKLKISVITE